MRSNGRCFHLFPIALSVCKSDRKVNNNSPLWVLNLVDAIKKTIDRKYGTCEDDDNAYSDDHTDQQMVNAIDWYNVLDLLRGYVISKNDNCSETPSLNTEDAKFSSQCLITDITNDAPAPNTGTANTITTVSTPSCSTTVHIITTADDPKIAPSLPALENCSRRPRTRFAGFSRDLPSFSDGVQPNLVDLINGYQNLVL